MLPASYYPCSCCGHPKHSSSAPEGLCEAQAAGETGAGGEDRAGPDLTLLSPMVQQGWEEQGKARKIAMATCCQQTMRVSYTAPGTGETWALPGSALAITVPGCCPLCPPGSCWHQSNGASCSTNPSPCNSFSGQKLHREGGMEPADQQSNAQPVCSAPEHVLAAPCLHGQLRDAPWCWEQAPGQYPGSSELMQTAHVPSAAPN